MSNRKKRAEKKRLLNNIPGVTYTREQWGELMNYHDDKEHLGKPPRQVAEELEARFGPPPTPAPDRRLEPKDLYAWPDVRAAQCNPALQHDHPLDAETQDFRDSNRCHLCGRTGPDLACFFYRSPAWSWEENRGVEGFIVTCDPCNNQIGFLFTRMCL